MDIPTIIMAGITTMAAITVTDITTIVAIDTEAGTTTMTDTGITTADATEHSPDTTDTIEMQMSIDDITAATEAIAAEIPTITEAIILGTAITEAVITALITAEQITAEQITTEAAIAGLTAPELQAGRDRAHIAVIDTLESIV